MRRHTHIALFLVLLLSWAIGDHLVGMADSGSGGKIPVGQHATVQSSLTDGDLQHRRVSGILTEDGSGNEAVLLSGLRTARVVGSRTTGKTFPGHLPKSGKPTTGLEAVRHHHSHINLSYVERLQASLAPFRSGVSCRYYVFALRRLLC